MNNINHPEHYGGQHNVYETINVIDAWDLGFCLGNAIKYISRAGKKNDKVEDLKKAVWYLEHEIKKITDDKIVINAVEQEYDWGVTNIPLGGDNHDE